MRRRTGRPLTAGELIFVTIMLLLLYGWFPGLHCLVFRDDPVPPELGPVALVLATAWIGGIIFGTGPVLRLLFPRDSIDRYK